jgi:glycosyltransferase involved in cell wall biosynthesis
MKIIVVIPAFNEERTIGQVIRSVKQYVPDIIVVNDGSEDKTGVIAKNEGASVYVHIINRGLGGALGTGITAALQQGADIIVTFDADGQHKAEDIPNLIRSLQNGESDIVIGSRMFNHDGMPFFRKIYNIFGNFLTYFVFGIHVSDSQSGLRAFSRKTASLMKLKANRMEVSSEIIREIKVNRLKFKEIPIKPIYTDYSLSKGQSFFVGLKTLLKLIVLRILK